MMRNHVATLARRGARSPSGPDSLDLGDGLAARRVGTGVSKALRGAPTETWVVHPTGDPGAPVLQAEIYKQGLGWTAWTGSLTRATDRELAQRVAHARNAGHTTVAERRSDHGGGYGGMVMSPASDRRRWDELHAAHAVARTAVDDYERQLGPKYGWSQSWRSWITKTERDKLDRLEAKRDKIGDKIIELLVRVSPRGEAWLSGVPTWWIKEKLTWEDAVRPVDEPLSVEVPLSWGNTRRLTEESHGEACTCEKDPPRPMKAKSRLDLILDRVVAGEREVTIDTDGYTTDQVDRIIATAKGRGFNASYDGRFVLIRDMRIPTHRRGQETQESEVNDDSRTNHVLTLIARRDRRDWSQMPFGYERDAVKAAYQDIKPFFDQRDVSARIAASKAATFDELRQAVSRMQHID